MGVKFKEKKMDFNKLILGFVFIIFGLVGFYKTNQGTEVNIYNPNRLSAQPSQGSSIGIGLFCLSISGLGVYFVLTSKKQK